MSVLRNGRHENFAQQIAAGKSTTDAYLLAGYKSSRLKARQHGYRLKTRGDITARIQELVDKPQGRIATQQIVEAIRTGQLAEPDGWGTGPQPVAPTLILFELILRSFGLDQTSPLSTTAQGPIPIMHTLKRNQLAMPPNACVADR